MSDRQLRADLMTLRAMMADPDQVVRDRWNLFENWLGVRLPAVHLPDGNSAIPQNATRGCLLGNMARIVGDLGNERYNALSLAVGDHLHLFLSRRDNELLDRIDDAIAAIPEDDGPPVGPVPGQPPLPV